MYKTKILVRFDDICPTMDFNQFLRAINLLDKYEIKPLIGVIPDCLDSDLMIEKPHEDFWHFIKNLQARGYTIAMHGYQHIFESNHRGIVTRRLGSEFAGLPYDVQVDKLRKGKAILSSHGIETDVFFAPAHSYDENTIKALSVVGFKYMSDGKSPKAYVWHGIKCLPCKTGGCPKIRNASNYTAVFHAHEWVRPEKAVEYDRLVDLLETHPNMIVSFEKFSKQRCGHRWVQGLLEKCFVHYQAYIRPQLVKLYFKILKQ